MIGDMIAKIRKEKNMSKTELAEKTNINIGHLTHIEKGERSPSYKALKAICIAAVPALRAAAYFMPTYSANSSSNLFTFFPNGAIQFVSNASFINSFSYPSSDICGEAK